MQLPAFGWAMVGHGGRCCAVALLREETHADAVGSSQAWATVRVCSPLTLELVQAGSCGRRAPAGQVRAADGEAEEVTC